jgi:hypothetical protein
LGGGSGAWVNLAPPNSQFRFVVEGLFVPEASSLHLFVICGLAHFAGRRASPRR